MTATRGQAAGVRVDDIDRTTAVAEPSFSTVLLAVFSLLALVLSFTGVYAVVAVLVGRRTQEIGVWIAMGAPGRAVVGLLVRQELLPVVIGLTRPRRPG